MYKESIDSYFISNNDISQGITKIQYQRKSSSKSILHGI
jgi:hypothetical protein